MSFRNRLLFGMTLIMAAFIAATAVAYGGLRSTSAQFGAFLDGVGALNQGYREMYAQGLQMGQALRNIVLDPANPKAYQNLEKARNDFATARESATHAAATVDGFAQAVNRLEALASAQANAQIAVMAALKANQTEEAKGLINSSETPAWRSLKQALLDDIDTLQKLTETQRSEVAAKVERLQAIILGLSLLAVVIGIASVVTTLAYVRRELGSEPAYARQVANSVATGDLSQPIALENGDTSSLLASLASMQQQLRQLVGSLAGHARDIEHTARQVSEATDQVAAGSSQQLSFSQEMVGNAQNLADSLRDVMAAVTLAEQIVETSSRTSGAGAALASKAATETEAMAGSVRATASDIQQLGTQSAKINSILGVISDIASQTNLLALNAAIEAARAGDQGRGFAVVADEVRNLARRTAASTSEIQNMINALQSSVRQAVEAIRASGEVMTICTEDSENTKQAIDTISNELQHIADLSSQIAAAAEQQQCTSAEIARNMNNINGIADENRTALDQVGHTSEQLQQLSREQQALVHKFTL